MTQYDIEVFLKKQYPRSFSAKEIAEILKIQYSTINQQLNGLLKTNIILYNKVQKDNKYVNEYIYNNLHDDFIIIDKEFNALRSKDGINIRPFEYYQNQQIIKELKEIKKEMMKNGNNNNK